MTSGKIRAVGNMHVFVPFQIDVINKQLVSPLWWDNLSSHLRGQNPLRLSETWLGESYILMI